jgi:TonB-linked SusC/RagA family outer membrane protein
MEKTLRHCFGFSKGQRTPYLIRTTMFAMIFTLSMFQLQAADTAHTEDVISVSFQDATLKDAFSVLENKTHYKFFYNHKVVDTSHRVTLSLRNSNIETVLTELFRATGVTFRIKGDQIVLRKKRFMAAVSNELFSGLARDPEAPAATAAAPIRDASGALVFAVSGRITDETGQPMPGVNVLEKGTSTGTATDQAGRYTLTVRDENAVLVVSFIGYVTQEVNVGGRAEVNVNLLQDIQSLQEVVVVGYGTQRKSDLTGAVSTVKGDDIKKLPVATVDQALQGRASGVTVTSNSGSPGTPVQIRVRGIGTINNSSPLFVVDGYPVDNINFLNSADIASMEVLKDASATAIYGSRGANGVILITTRSGKKSETTTIAFDSYLGFSQMWRKPKLLDASQWGMLNTEAQNNAGNPIIYPELQNYQSLGKGTDWIDAVTRTAITRNNNLSISGGTDKVTYFISANNYKQEGIVDKSDFERTSVRLNTSIKTKKWLTIGENLTLEGSTQHKVNEADEWGSVLIEASNIDPITHVRNPDGSFGATKYMDTSNPVAQINYTNAYVKAFNVVGNVFCEVQLSKSFQFRSNLGLTYFFGRDQNFVPVYYVSTSQRNEISSLSNTANNSRTWTWSNYFTYNKDIGQHSLSVLAGTEAYNTFVEYFDTRVSDLIDDQGQFRYVDNALNIYSTSSGAPTDIKRISSLFGRLNYSYADKYLFTANIRRDGSSNFVNDRYGIFPSFSAGWQIGKENFMTDVSFLSSLKLRAGWGRIGNEKIPAFGYQNPGKLGQSYIFNNQIVNGITFPNVANPNLHWETTTTTNIGVDGALFSDKLTFTAEYYVKKTEDMLVAIPPPAHTGIQDYPYQNVGSMQNKGFELELGYGETKGDFSYRLSGNFSTYRNKVLSLGGLDQIEAAPLRNQGNVSVTRVGGPVGQFQGYKTDGIFQNEAAVLAHVDNDGNLLQPNAAPGDIRYAKGSDGQLYFGAIGNPLPKFTYGFNANFAYKAFDLSIFLQGVYGNDVFNGTLVYTERPDAAYNLTTRMLGRWTGEGTTNDARFPRMNAADANNNWFSDRYVEKGSYLRMKNVQLGYTLPRALMNKLSIQSLRLYVSATNLFTVTNYTGFDPEIGNGYYGSLDLGIDRATYPQPRIFTGGINLTF